MKITSLGTGDTVGTPMVGCSCSNCMYAKEHGIQRLRTSLLIESNDGRHLLIDTSPDLRQQLLAAGSPHIDAIIWTHGHYDHIMGFPDFYRVQRETLQVYGAPEVLRYCGSIFSFIKHREIPIKPFEPILICGLEVTFFPVEHDTPTYGLRIRSEGKTFVYTCDTCNLLSDRTLDTMKNADLFLVDGIFPADVHISKHMNIAEAEELAISLGSKEFWCVHMSHKIPFDYPYGAKDMQNWQL